MTGSKIAYGMDDSHAVLLRIHVLLVVAIAMASCVNLSTPALMEGSVMNSPQSGNSEAPLDCRAFDDQATSKYILPWPSGEEHFVSETTGHYRTRNGGVGLYAIDIDLPLGTHIVAVRSGVVVAVREHFPDDDNGLNLHENFVFVLHEDKSVARYLHVLHAGVYVELGEFVEQGQVIALSGSSGQNGPHLHFDVQKCGPNLPPGYNTLPCGQTLPVSFRNTREHKCGLRAGEYYFAIE